MKRPGYLLLSALLSAAIALLSSCANHAVTNTQPAAVETLPAPEAEPSPVFIPEREEEREPPAVSVLEGTVVRAEPKYITVKTADGAVYSFGSASAEISVPSVYLGAGYALTVTFLGELDPNLDIQDVKVTHIGAAEKQLYENALLMRAREMLYEMDTESKVGQLFLIQSPGGLSAQVAAEYRPGGYILFARDFEGRSKEQVCADIRNYQASSEIPLLIGVDEEGGTVNRVSLFREFRAEPFRSPRELYKQGGFELIIGDAEEKSELLRSLGINVNLAPVCDLSGSEDSFIYKRSFGDDAELTSVYVRSVVTAMAAGNMGSVLKHFPGYGDNADTHNSAAYDSRPYDVFLSGDFLPFRAGIEAGADAVMVSHGVVLCMDQNNPASLSPEVHRILREELGFQGVIMTDDLAMGAVGDLINAADAAVLAICAGNDMLCTSNYREQIPAVIRAVNEGVIPEERIDDSVLRVLLWKLKRGITS
jgi:beta-N-acetylhexosaminidase